jgi:hypothetical protein
MNQIEGAIENTKSRQTGASLSCYRVAKEYRVIWMALSRRTNTKHALMQRGRASDTSLNLQHEFELLTVQRRREQHLDKKSTGIGMAHGVHRHISAGLSAS